jgi:hypothetical protein
VTVSDLFFGAFALATVGMLVAIGWHVALGHRATSLQLLRALGIGWGVYAAMLLLSSVATPQRYLAIGEALCSDDWCISVSRVNTRAMTDSVQLDVTLRLESRARGVSQRERFVSVYLVDADGMRYNPRTNPADVPFDTLLTPGQSLLATRRFLIPGAVTIDGLVVAREGAGRFPGCCIIGDDNSLLHKRPVARLQPR